MSPNLAATRWTPSASALEAKDNNHGVGDGMQQGLGYADMLDVPFVFSSNGDGFLLHEAIEERKAGGDTVETRPVRASSSKEPWAC